MDQIPNQSSVAGTKKSVGPAIGIVIIIVVLVIGALYFWGGKLNQAPESSSTSDAYPAMSQSDEVTDIANDLSATVINGVDSDYAAMESELNAQ